MGTYTTIQCTIPLKDDEGLKDALESKEHSFFKCENWEHLYFKIKEAHVSITGEKWCNYLSVDIERKSLYSWTYDKFFDFISEFTDEFILGRVKTDDDDIWTYPTNTQRKVILKNMDKLLKD